MLKITEVRIKLMGDPDDRLRAFCSITFDDSFVVRDLKIIDGSTGPFVAMPSRRLTAHCGSCGSKNHLRATYCNQCGKRQKITNSGDQNGRAKLYADIAHPINAECRELIQTHIIRAFEAEKVLASQPGYKPRYDDVMDYDDSSNPNLQIANTPNIGVKQPATKSTCDNQDDLSKQSPLRRTDNPVEPSHHPIRQDAGTEQPSAGKDFGSGVV